MISRIGLASLVLLALLGPSRANNGVVTLAKTIQTPIQLDGDLSDWPSEEMEHPISLVTYGDPLESPADLTAGFSTRYHVESQTLFVAVRAFDDTTVFGSPGKRAWNSRDGCEIYLSIFHGTDGIEANQYSCFDVSGNTQRSEGASVSVAARRVDGLHTYEWAFKLRELNQGQPVPPSFTCAFDVVIADRDSQDNFSWLSWGPESGKFLSSQNTGDLIIGDQNVSRVHLSLASTQLLETSGPLVIRYENLSNPELVAQIKTDNQGRGYIDLPKGHYHCQVVRPAGCSFSEEIEVTGETKQHVLDIAPIQVGSEPLIVRESYRMGSGMKDRATFEYTMSDGIPSGNLNDMRQADDGSHWLTTNTGLARMVGKNILTYDLKDQGRDYYSRLHWSAPHLWLGGPDGLLRITDQNITRFPQIDGHEVTSIERFKKDTFVGTDNGLYAWNGEEFRHVDKADLPSREIRALALSSDQNELWIGTKEGIFVLDDNGFRLNTASSSMPDGELLTLGLASDGKIWLGTMFGLYKGVENVFETIMSPLESDRYIGNYCRTIHRDRTGKLYAATRNGTFLIHHPEHPEAKQRRVNASPNSRFAYKDSENQLWIGTEESLVRRDANIYWLNSSEVSSISAGKDSIHFVAKLFQQRAAFRYEGEKAKRLDAYPNPWAVFQHSNGDIWVSHAKGATILSGDQNVQLHEHSDWPEDRITRFFEDTDGSVWMTTGSSGIFHYHNDRITNYRIRDSLPGNDVRAISRDTQGRLWIGTISGLAYLKDLKVHHLTTRDGLISPFINDLLQASDGTFWIASDAGLQSVHDGVIKDTFTMKDGILSASVNVIEEDKHGHLWIGTEIGVNRYDGQTMQSLIPTDGIPRGRVQHLQSSRFGMVIGTARGCALYQTNRFHPATGVQPAEITLLSSDPTYQFPLSGASHKTRENGLVRRYRLPGVIDDWQSTTQSFIAFPKLPVGAHSLEFQFVDRDLNYSAVEKIPITIQRNYRIIARWTLLATAIAAALIFGILYIGRNRAVRKANRELEDRVEERTHQLQEETRNRLQTEKEKHLVHEQLQQAQKMDALGTLSSGIAHDFNNSLCAISNLAELARIEGDPDSRKDYLENLIDAAEQASDITRSLLTFGRKGNLEAKPCNLGHVVKRSVKLVQRLIPATVQIKVQLPKEAIFSKIDPSNMQQLLINLAVNARDAMEDSEVKTLTLALDRQDDKARLTISDTGTGMTDETKERLFEPFFTSKSRGKGTGLGLSIVHGIVAKLGGEITVESEEGKGTSFLLDLPICTGPVEEAEVISQPQPVDSSQSVAGKCVLIADDEPHVRKVIVATLQREGYRIIEAADGMEALHQFHQHIDDIDLVISDFDMPHRNGLSSLRAMHAERPNMPSILCSGLAQPAVDESNDVPLRFLQKPFSIKDISTLARELIQEKMADPLALPA